MTAQDPNFHLRNELMRDAQRLCAELGGPNAIIVSGDIAFAGAAEEFAFATTWLAELCRACGGSMDSVFVCPGNHDVVRSKADRNMVQLVHDAIKRTRPGDESDYIARQLRDPDAARLLYEGLDNYNVFALQFFCDLLPPERTRAKRDLYLNDGSILRLWGLNTVFVSSSRDLENDIFVDPASLQITREDGVVNLVVAHHHLSWIRQRRALEDHLNDVAPIQMFGHVHANRVDRNVEYLRLTASAVHPERHEVAWEPGYNLMQVTVEGTGAARSLVVRTHVRVWRSAPGGFQAKMDRSSDVFLHRIPLEAWCPPTFAAATVRGASDATGSGDPGGSTPVDGGGAMETMRDLGLRFYKLSFSKKSEIAGRLDLLEDQDMGQPDFERFRRVFIRAHERGKLAELAAAVRDAE